MESTQLRLLILVLGALLILGIYLWDKRKRYRYEQQKQAQYRPSVARQDPFIDESGQDTSADDIATANFVMQTGPDTASSDPVTNLSFTAQDTDGLDPALRELAPRLIIQLNITALEHQAYTGTAVAAAAQAVELTYRDGVYQRTSSGGGVMFSMASMVEPGTLPLDDETFTTCGLTLFSELPGVCDGMAIYSDMLFTAERLLALLGNGTLLDERHSTLTKQTIGHMREVILEHRRQIQLLKRHDKR